MTVHNSPFGIFPLQISLELQLQLCCVWVQRRHKWLPAGGSWGSFSRLIIPWDGNPQMRSVIYGPAGLALLTTLYQLVFITSSIIYLGSLWEKGFPCLKDRNLRSLLFPKWWIVGQRACAIEWSAHMHSSSAAMFWPSGIESFAYYLIEVLASPWRKFGSSFGTR